MSTTIGPHLLGRRFVADERDWDVGRLHRELASMAPLAAIEPPDSLLDETVRQAVSDSPFFQTWRAFLQLWRWVKKHLHPVPDPAPPSPSDSPAWEDLVVLDQGDYGTCVGNGWAGWGDSAPVEDRYRESDARAIYYESTVIGGSPDLPTDPPDYSGGQQGSSVRDGAKAMRARGRLAAYAFASGTLEVREWLANHGPVVFGTDWTSSMFSPDPETALVRVVGEPVGGHCYLCVDYEPGSDTFVFVNSWGRGWGADGTFRVSASDVAVLLSRQGEACCAVELP